AVAVERVVPAVAVQRRDCEGRLLARERTGGVEGVVAVAAVAGLAVEDGDAVVARIAVGRSERRLAVGRRPTGQGYAVVAVTAVERESRGGREGRACEPGTAGVAEGPRSLCVVLV